MYGYQCEYCEGTVQPRLIKREVFKHRDGFVILEDVTIGVCVITAAIVIILLKYCILLML